MSQIDTLIEMKQKVEKSKEFPANQTLLMIEMIQKREAEVNAEKDYFVYFYGNVLGSLDVFDFSNVLDNYYTEAQEHASVCVSLFIDFKHLESNKKLQNWLQSAIRFVDCIVIHYLQEVLGESPTRQKDAGVEKSRYMQINRKEVKAEKAGRIMADLYGERSKMEHITKSDPNNPGNQILVPPNFNKVRRKILKRFPEALESFNNAFKSHYEQSA